MFVGGETTSEDSSDPMYEGDPAGGDLTGEYPNPTITGAKIVDGTITGAEIADGTLTPAKFSTTDGFVFTIDDQTVSGTKIFSRAQMAGNPIDSTDIATKQYVDDNIGVIDLQDASISGNYIATRAILHGHIGTNQLLTRHFSTGVISGSIIATASILNGHLADSSISGNKIQANAIWGGHLVDSIASGNKIQSQGVLGGHIASNTIAGSNLLWGTISGNNIATSSIGQGSIVNGYVDLSSNQTVSGTKIFQLAQGAGYPTNSADLTTKAYVDSLIGNAGGDLAGTYPNPTIRLSAVSGNYIHTSAILGGHIASNTILNGNLADSSISGNKIQANSILQGHLAANSVGSNEIINSSISGNKIQANSVLQGHVLSGYTDLNTFQVVSGIKTFFLARGAGYPIDGNDLATKAYVDATAGAPVGAVGGDLAGSLPNPTIRLSAISGNYIHTASILNGHLADSAVSGNKIHSQAILPGHLNSITLQEAFQRSWFTL